MASSPAPTVMWFRRDLRLTDNPALLDACGGAGESRDSAGVLPVFVLDPALWEPAGPSRRHYLAGSLRALDASLGAPGLSVRHGDPVQEVVRAARDVGADRVHVAADFNPYGHRRDAAVEEALGEHGIQLVRTGSPYAVAPGRVRNGSGDPFKVFTPFSSAWAEHDWRAPAEPPPDVRWVALEDTVAIPDVDLPAGLELPRAGEEAARERWATYVDDGLERYADRNRPDLDATSHMSVHLKWGEIHPRTMLADLAQRTSRAAATYRKELAWREFYADVIFARPESAREYLRPEFARMRYDEPGDRLRAWQEGRTGYPIVDAGMRQMRGIGWMHNRLRMIVASFLVKDLHLEWQHGARHFMHGLVDGDLASNQHGWQWVAGCGTDAAPYFRVFNPVLQGQKFDPDGAYVRRWVPELRDVDPAYVHEPWTDPAGLPAGYPERVVDHAVERRESLARLEELKQ